MLIIITQLKIGKLLEKKLEKMTEGPASVIYEEIQGNSLQHY